MTRRGALWIAASVAVVAAGAHGAGEPGKAPKGGIAWYGTWEAGLREAKRTNRPILLIAAAPHCHNVSGIW
jgi:hypothetical protein